MALQTSGQISLNDVNVELGNSGTAQIDMNSSAVRGLFGISSGEIEMADGYGAANEFSLTLSSNTKQANLSSLATAAGWNGSSAVVVTINSGIYVWSDSTSTPGLLANIANCTITNNGKIMGKGGTGGYRLDANGFVGGPALSVTASGVTITNNSGGFIAGGGGGGGSPRDEGVYGNGGGGAGGGRGGHPSNNGAAGGGLGIAGSNGYTGTHDDDGTITTYPGGLGGNQGGQGGVIDEAGSSRGSSGGGGGGRVLTGSGQGGNGSNGGYGNGGRMGGRGGNWGGKGGTGRSGSAGSNGGAAITNSVSYTLSNSGIIYGAT